MRERGQVMHAASNRSDRLWRACRCRRQTARAAERAAQGPEGFQADRHGGEAPRFAGESRRHGDVRPRRAPARHEVYAAIVNCPVFGGTLASVDDTNAKKIPGVRQVVKVDNAVAVIGDHTWAAKRGAAGARHQVERRRGREVVQMKHDRRRSRERRRSATARSRARTATSARRFQRREDARRRRLSAAVPRARDDGAGQLHGARARRRLRRLGRLAGADARRRCRRAVTGLPADKITSTTICSAAASAGGSRSISSRRRSRSASRSIDAGQGHLDARRRHPARHVPAVLLRRHLRRPRCERQADRVAASDCRLVDPGAFRAARVQERSRPGRGGSRRPICRTTCRTSWSTTCGRNRATFRPRSGAASVRRAARSWWKALSTNSRRRRRSIRSSTASDLLGKTPRARTCSTSPRRRPDWGNALPKGQGRGVSVMHAFGSFFSIVVGRHRRQRRGGREPRRVRGRLRDGGQSEHDRGADTGRHHLRHHGGALQRDHDQGRPRRAKQLHRLPDAAHRPDTADRGAYRQEQRGAGRHRRTGHGGARACARPTRSLRRPASGCGNCRSAVNCKPREGNRHDRTHSRVAVQRWRGACRLPRRISARRGGRRQALVARGAYLAKVGDCVACHSAPKGKPFAGGLPMTTPMGQHLHHQHHAGSGNRHRQLERGGLRRRRCVEGVAKDGHNLYPAMPYPSYAKVHDDDVKALYAYFMKGVAPVQPGESRVRHSISAEHALAAEVLEHRVPRQGRVSGQERQGRRVESRRVPDPGSRPLRLVPHAARHRVPGEGARRKRQRVSDGRRARRLVRSRT